GGGCAVGGGGPRVAFEPGHGLGNRDISELFDEPLEDAAADFRMRHFASAEENRRLDLVAFFEEALDVLLLELVIVLVDFRTELDLFDQNHLLVLLGFARALLFLILVLTEVHDAANWWVCRRRDLDEVETLRFRDGQGLRRRHDAELCSVIVDHADFSDPDPFVDTNAIVTARSSVECDNYLLIEGLLALDF